MQVIYYAGGMPFRDEIIQVFAVDVNEHNNDTGEDTLIKAIGTLKIDGAVTLFKAPEKGNVKSTIENIIFTSRDVLDLRGCELFSVQQIDEFNARKRMEESGYTETENDEFY